jgi:hypothetical protein
MGTYDLVTIDGSHFYEDVIIDLREGWRLAKRIMVVDDITFPGVAQAMTEFEAGASPKHRFLFDGGFGVAVYARTL